MPKAAHLLLAAAALCAACGGDEPAESAPPAAFAEATAPPPAPTAAETPAGGERWAYTASEIRFRDGGREVPCSMEGVTITLEAADSVLSGSSTGGTLRCEGMPERPVTSDPIGSGVVRGDSVIFRIGPLVHRGTRAGGVIRGIITGEEEGASGAFRMVAQP